MSEASNKRVWLKPFLAPVRPIFREVIAMSAFVNLMALAVPVFTMQVYDRVIGHGGLSTLVGFIIGMFIVLVFDYILRVSRSRIMQTVALRIDVLVGHKLFNKLMELPLQELEGRPASYWQALFRDVDTVRNTLSGASALLICDLPFVFLFFIIIFMIAPPLVPVLAVIIPLFMFIAWRSAAAMSEANKNASQTTQTRDALIAEMIQGRATVKALALDRAMGPMWADRHAENIETSVMRGAKSDFFSSFGGSLTMLSTIFMTSVGAFLIIEGTITMGALVATNMLTGRLIGPANQLVGQWRAFSNFNQALSRLGDVFAMESERTVSEVSLGRPKGNLLVENVTFAYGQDAAPVLDNVSAKIPAGGVHALVGRNGSGKTTLMKIIQGLYRPQEGRVLIDGADINQFSRLELASWIGYVPQETVLFAGTIRDNIIHRDPEASDEAIIKAATEAGVHHFIIDLPDGYSTDIGEAGRRLSGGQRQRIAVARALLGDPPVLLLDEPSANLDRQAEQALRKTLVEIGKERSVIIVTHSPILLAACDDLIALDKGKVALAGPSREILPKLFGQQPGGPAPAAKGGRQTKPQDLPVPMEPQAGAGAAQPPAQPARPPAAAPAGARPSSPPPLPRPGANPPPQPARQGAAPPPIPRPSPKAPQPAAAAPPPPRPATPPAQAPRPPAPAAKAPPSPRPATPPAAAKPPAPPRPAAPAPAAKAPAPPRPAAQTPPPKPAQPPRPAQSPKPAAQQAAAPKAPPRPPTQPPRAQQPAQKATPPAAAPQAPKPQAPASKPQPPAAPRPAAPTPVPTPARAPAQAAGGPRPAPPSPRPAPPAPRPAGAQTAAPQQNAAPRAQPVGAAGAGDDPYAELIRKAGE